MRHRVKGKKLGRDTSHRKALRKNLATSLIKDDELVTTVAKAKYLRPYIERLVTKAKNYSESEFNTRKYLSAKLFGDGTVEKLVNEIAPRYKSRKGGYTRVIRLGNRSGDNSMLARISFVEEK